MNITTTDDLGSVLTEVIDGTILKMSLNRPAKRNGMTPPMWDQLVDAYEQLDASDSLRVGLLCAEGGHFTGGMDMPRWAHLKLRERIAVTPVGRVDPLGMGERRCRKPVVVAVEGVCYTVGLELALAADIVVAAEDCRFSQLEVKRGVVAFGGATMRMVERAGWGNAMSILLTGDELDAKLAQQYGFVQKLVPKGAALGEALNIARRIADAAPLAVRGTLANSRIYVERGAAAAIAHMEGALRATMNSGDASEGVQAFVERRPARFTGA